MTGGVSSSDTVSSQGVRSREPRGNRKRARPAPRPSAVSIYLHHNDRARIRAFAAYLANEGLRVSDSQIIKAVLLMAQPDKRLVKAYLEVRGADQRYKQEPEE
jgi:hypothetical protein